MAFSISPNAASRGAIPPSAEAGRLIRQLRATHPAGRERFLTTFILEELRALIGEEEELEADGPIGGDAIDSLTIVEFRDRLQTHVGERPELPATLVFDHPSLEGPARQAAHLVEPRTAEGLAEALRRVATDAAFREELRQRSLRAAQEYRWEKTARETMALLAAAAAELQGRS